MQNALQTVGCKPPYWSSKSSLPLCSKRKQLYDINFLVANDAALGDEMEVSYAVRTPCRSLESIQYDVMDVETPEKWKKNTTWMNESIGVILDFTELSYKEIKRVRGMDVQALIGNVMLFNVFIRQLLQLYLPRFLLKWQYNSIQRTFQFVGQLLWVAFPNVTSDN